MAADPQDPFGTQGLRQRVLDAWAVSPARFREDANAEEDLVRGGYRDRVVVELAQNAADAAARAGEPGRLALVLAGDTLSASNTGAPLDTAGVESLSTLRASTKRGTPASVGRFGVGFAAVLAVSDDPAVLSTSGGVQWRSSAARGAAAGLPALADELARRAGAAPVLRLPWPDGREPEPGWVTTVVLPLRDAAATDLVHRLLADVDDALLLALPDLAEVAVEVDGVGRVVAGADRWRVLRRSGAVDPDLLADRPLEERGRQAWTVTWALPIAGQPVPQVLHAPTPTDEPVGLPALLVASFPLDPTRRHVAPGPLADRLVDLAAQVYAELAAAEPHPLALLPAPVPLGRLDGALRDAVTSAMSRARLLATTDGSLVTPAGSTAVTGADGDLRRLLAEALGPLVADHPALERVGGRRVPLTEAVEQLAALDRPPGWWRDLYAALDAAAVRDPEVLAVLPVPLADGRLVRGPRGVLLPAQEVGARAADVRLPGLRLAHPDAVHPLLRRAGATDAGPRALLAAPGLRVAVEDAWDEADPLALADAVLPLVAAAALRPAELPWLAALPLSAADGEPAQADELVLPGSPLARVADRELVGEVAADLVDRWGPQVLAAVGVLAAFSVVETTDVVLDDASVDEPLEAWARYALDRLPVGELLPTARTVLVVPELDAVADDRWPDVLRLLSADPAVRAAVVSPVRLELGDGRAAEVPSCATWLLRSRAVLAGRAATDWALPGAGLDGLYDVLDATLVAGVDPGVLAAAGVRGSMDDVLAEPGGADELLRRLADEDRAVPAATWSLLWPALAATHPDDVTPPGRVRVAPDRVADATQVVVVDRAEHLQVVGADALVVPLGLSRLLADLLDLDLSSEVVAGPDLGGGTVLDVPDAVRSLVAGLPATWWEHDALSVDGRPVQWWRDDDGGVHASTSDGLARGLAAAAGRWADRLLLAAAMETPTRLGELVTEARLED
ncbi:MAG: hypothetical protein ABI807_03615 [Sporichthyaceae bacterium]